MNSGTSVRERFADIGRTAKSERAGATNADLAQANLLEGTAIMATTTLIVNGRYLAQDNLGRIKRALIGADLHTGRMQLVTPTVLQSAVLAKVDVTEVRHALRHLDDRDRIETAPTVLALPAPRGNGTAILAPQPNGADDALFDFVRKYGVDRVLTIAAAVEQEQLDR
jgi:hypothetical protein